MSQTEISTVAPPEQAAAPIGADAETKEPNLPAPMATGNERITIPRHELSIVPVPARMEEIEYARPPTADGVELAIRNISGSTIATAVFEAIFYDEEGKILDIVKQREIDLKPDTSRAVRIPSSLSEHDKIKSYHVRLVRATTAEVEKIQLRRHELTTTETGDEEIQGTVINLSQVKTDAAIVATFYDFNNENIGTKVVILRDIEPDAVRQYSFRFKPQEGDSVRTFSLSVGDLVE